MYILKDQESWGNGGRMSTSTVFWLLLLLLKYFLSHSRKDTFFLVGWPTIAFARNCSILALRVLSPGKSSPPPPRPPSQANLDSWSPSICKQHHPTFCFHGPTQSNVASVSAWLKVWMFSELTKCSPSYVWEKCNSIFFLLSFWKFGKLFKISLTPFTFKC